MPARSAALPTNCPRSAIVTSSARGSFSAVTALMASLVPSSAGGIGLLARADQFPRRAGSAQLLPGAFAIFANPISADAISNIFEFTRSWPGTGGGGHFVLFQTGDQVNAVTPEATAFVHRSSDWVMALSLSWKATDTAATVQRNRMWQNEFYDAVVPFALPESYQNFIDPSLNNWPQA
jgi:hypothetical protein